MILCIKFSKKENSSNFKAIEKETLIQENNADYLVIISRKEIYDFQTDKKDAWIYIGRPSCPDCQNEVSRGLEDNAQSIIDVTGTEDANLDYNSSSKYAVIADGNEALVKIPESSNDEIIIDDGLGNTTGMQLPSAEFIRELYELDSNISENRIEEIMRGYEMKIDLFSRWQKGEDLKKIVVNFKSKPSNKNMKDIFVE